MQSKNDLKKEKKLLTGSFAASILFLATEVFFAIITGSKAILMDCIYEVANMMLVGPFLILIPKLGKPVSEKRPFGLSQVESLFVLIKYLVLLVVGLGMTWSCLQNIFTGGNDVEAGLVITYEFSVSAGCVIMFFILSRLSRDYRSPSLKAELYIWKVDALATMGVGAAFILKIIFDFTPLAFLGPYFDPGVAVIIAVALLKEPVVMIIDAIKCLLLFSPQDEDSEKAQAIVEERMAQDGCTVSFMEVLKTGRKYWVQVYFQSERNIVDIALLKAAHRDILAKLEEVFESVDLDLLPDVEEYSHVKAKARN